MVSFIIFESISACQFLSLLRIQLIIVIINCNKLIKGDFLLTIKFGFCEFLVFFRNSKLIFFIKIYSIKL